MASSKDKTLFERQKQEMEDIERELDLVRNQYHKICKERGTAHVSARLVQKHEQEMIEFESRRDKLVRVRAQKVAKDEERQVRNKNKESESKKKELIGKRKEIFNRDWNGHSGLEPKSTSAKQIEKLNRRKEIEAQLAKLAAMEKSLEEKINEKKKKCQKDNDDVPVYDLSTDSEVEEDETDPHFVGHYFRSRGHHHHHNHRPQVKAHEKRTDSGFLDNDPITDPDLIARNVLRKLELMKDGMRKAMEAVATGKQDKTQMYKDTAVNTTKPKQIRETLVREELPSGTSSSSSYRSLPKTVQPKNREFAQLMTKLKEQCLNDEPQTEFNPNIVEGGDCGSSVKSDDVSDDFAERVKSLIEMSGIARSSSGHHDRLEFWREVCQEAGTILHEETAAAMIANMSEASKNRIIGGDDDDSDTGSVIIHSPVEEVNSKSGHSTPKGSPTSKCSAETLKGILEERSLTFASSFSSCDD